MNDPTADATGLIELEAVVVVATSVEVMTPSHQPFAGAQLRIHCEAIGLSRRSSLVSAVRLALSFDKAWLG